jgi:hypothetical protein
MYIVKSMILQRSDACPHLNKRGGGAQDPCRASPPSLPPAWRKEDAQDVRPRGTLSMGESVNWVCYFQLNCALAGSHLANTGPRCQTQTCGALSADPASINAADQYTAAHSARQSLCHNKTGSKAEMHCPFGHKINPIQCPCMNGACRQDTQRPPRMVCIMRHNPQQLGAKTACSARCAYTNTGSCTT